MYGMQTSQQTITVVLIGIALAFCFGLLVFLVCRNPKKAKKIAVSFVYVEVRRSSHRPEMVCLTLYTKQVLLILRISFDGLDFYTESVVQAGSMLWGC